MTNPSPYQQTTANAGWHLEQSTGRYRWWDGQNWGVYQDQMPAAPVAVMTASTTNGFAVAALILGIWGFCTTWIPFFIGFFLGGLPDLLAVIFGIIGITRANRPGGTGLTMAVFGLVLGGLALISIFFGAGTIW